MAHVSEQVGIVLLFLLLGEVPDVYISAIATSSQDAWGEWTPLNFDYTVFLAWQTRQSPGQISEVPNWYIFVCWSRSKEKFIERWEIKRVDLISMRNDFKDGFLIITISRASESSVPDTDESVVWAAGEDTGMEFVPGNIFYGGIVMQNFKDGLYSTIFLLVLLNVPDTNPFIWEPREQEIFVDCVPAQAITLAGVTDQFTHGFVHSSECDISFACGHSYDFGIGRAVSGTIDLSTVLDLFDYTYFVSFPLEVAICFALVGIVDFDFEELTLLRICVAGGDDGEVAVMVLVRFWFGQPLEGIGRPVDGMK